MNRKTKCTVVFVVLFLTAGGGLALWLFWRQHAAGFQTAVRAGNGANAPLVAANAEPPPATQCLDLASHFNDSLDAGWQHQLTPGNNLGTLPRGRQVFDGVPFEVRGIIQLTSQKLRQFAGVAPFPEQVRGIQVGRKCQALHFLHATGWNAAPGTRVGSYVIHYADDTSEEVRIPYGDETGNWWALPVDLKYPGPGVVWQGTNAAKQTVQLFKQTWINLRPDLEIRSLDFKSSLTRVAPFLIAVTAE